MKINKGTFQKNKGITLVALVVTIVVILIISGVAISLITGENGLFAKANSAGTRYKDASQNEKDRLSSLLNSEYLQLATSGTVTTISQADLERIIDARIANLSTQVSELSAEVETLKTQGGSSSALDAYPIGSIYITTNNTNPSELFGGEWEKYAEGRTLIGTGSTTDARSETLTFALGATGGEFKHVITEAEMAKHRHSMSVVTKNAVAANQAGWNGSPSPVNSASTQYTNYVGSNSPHNNMQPYIATHMWKRTA